MKRLTRQRRHGQGKGLRSPLFWGGLLVAVPLLAVTFAWLENVGKMDLPKVPEEESGKLIFYDALKKPDGAGSDAMALVPEKEPSESRSNPDHPVKIAKAPPKPESPAPKKEPARKTLPAVKAPEAPPARGDGIFSVQVAASKDRKAAEDLKDRLVENGYPGYMRKENVPGKGVWYRIRVGPFDQKEEARKMIQRIKEQAKLTGILVVEKRATD